MSNYKNFLEAFDEHLVAYKNQLLTKSPKELYEPEAYILSLGGKRVRPLLALVAADLFDKDFKIALNSALCVELFHNFSLIHDDILDQAPLRRNKPTVHIKWNTNIGILSGDVMLVKAFQTLQTYGNNQFFELQTIFSKTSIEVCEGQQEDINFETRTNVSVDEYIEMITKKTAVLLGCSLQMGAINANTTKEQQQLIYEFGKHLGIAFQLLDDLLDAFAKDAEKFGKQVGGDILANKKTFLLLKALELSSNKQKETIFNLYTETDATKKIAEMLAIYNQLNVKELCQQEADKHTQVAIDALNKLIVNDTKKANLKKFAFELLGREV